MCKNISVTTHSLASVYRLAATSYLNCGSSSVHRTQAHECVQAHLLSVRSRFQVETCCQIINNGKIVSCVWLSNVYTTELTPTGMSHVKIKRTPLIRISYWSFEALHSCNYCIRIKIPTSQKTHRFSTTNSRLFLLFTEIIAVCRKTQETNKQTNKHLL